MLNTLAIIQPRRAALWTDSKVGRKLGGKSLLEWVVRRVTDCQRLDHVVVALGVSEEDRAIAELVPPDVPVVVGPTRDGLERIVAAMDQYPCHAVVRVCAENPFVDPVLIDRLVNTADAHPTCDYISFCSSDGRPTILSQMGVFAEWCSAEALRRADREATQPLDRENATRFLYSHPETFNVRLIPVPAELDRDDVRLLIDLEEDWEHAQAIYEALGPEEWDWQKIAGFLDHQPALRKRMALLNRNAS